MLKHTLFDRQTSFTLQHGRASDSAGLILQGTYVDAASPFGQKQDVAAARETQKTATRRRETLVSLVLVDPRTIVTSWRLSDFDRVDV